MAATEEESNPPLNQTPIGELVRTLKDLPAEAGINRIYWDLRYPALPRPKLRTRTKQHSHVSLGDQGYRLLREEGQLPRLCPRQPTRSSFERETNFVPNRWRL